MVDSARTRWNCPCQWLASHLSTNGSVAMSPPITTASTPITLGMTAGTGERGQDLPEFSY